MENKTVEQTHFYWIKILAYGFHHHQLITEQEDLDILRLLFKKIEREASAIVEKNKTSI